jgi:hypothetical protein
MLLVSWVTGLDLRAPGPYLLLFYLGRFTSIGFAAGIVTLVYLWGRELYGRTGAVYAALVTALMAPFVYYGKTTNLEAPYLFWFMASLLSYIRILKRHAITDYLWFGVTATLAVCTKDQAYGLFAATPVAILAARWRRGLPIVDRTTMMTTLAAVVTFVLAENLLFNVEGFLAHVKVITGPASSSYQMFPGTLRGQLDMARLALGELAHVFGWPMMCVVTVALVWGCVRGATTPSLAWLLVPALSYYATFLGVVLYFYDRFLLPIALVLAIGAGAWLERFTAPGVAARRVRLAAVGAVFVYTLLYAGMVDYVLSRDSRIVVSNWVRARIAPGDLVAARGPLEYFLVAEGFQAVSVESVGHVKAVRPAFVVLNADHMAVLAPGHRTRVMRDYLASAASGYCLVMRYRTPSLPLPGRHPDLGPVIRMPELSSLGQLNPPLELFVRADVAVRIGL